MTIFVEEKCKSEAVAAVAIDGYGPQPLGNTLPV
jgi:hypothetical protein